MINKTIHLTRKKLWAAICILAALTVFAVVGVLAVTGNSVSASAKISKTHYFASNNAERISFLNSYGWTVSEEPSAVKEIIIPEEFNDVYLKYNEIQSAQGLDLSKYKGLRAKLWCYDVLNYPDYSKPVHANIIIIDNRIIGGDISASALDGFMHGFTLDKSVKTSASAA